ncbi:unnamed protein product [Cylindrotheca closterium]|uniref:Helicase-associated domain-containing protein n=1 Tax=Cylindrotheca closterium TaxID=2856 RepID=A0AAD2CV59_9STRA|nr:unnamed protein product [Cylindrotheca closterium]
MAKDKSSPHQDAKRTRKRNAEDALLDDSTPSKTDVSDQGDSDGAGRNANYNAKTNENGNTNGHIYNGNTGVSNGESKPMSRTKDTKISDITSSQGGSSNNKPSADRNNEEQSDSNGEEPTTTQGFVDQGSPLPRKRRKKPSQKLLLQKEVDQTLDEIESGENHSNQNNNNRRPPKRKASVDNGGTRFKKARLKKFDPVEEKAVLERALQKGLPEGWKVAYHKDWKRKVWISPDDSRICDTIPRAISIAQKMILEAEPEDAEREAIDYDGNDEEDGSDEGESGTRVPGSFVTLKKGPSPSGTDPASVLIATSEELHEMSVEQERAALKRGREKGLKKDGWRCVWNSRFRRKNWVSPQGKIFGNLSRAVEKQDHWMIKEEKRKLKQNRKMQEMEREWQKQFKRLKKYKRRHGGTVVPDNSENYSELRSWSRRQRREYLRAQKGERTRITTEQIAALNQIGFQWEVEKVPKVSKKGSKKKDAVAVIAPAEKASSCPPLLDGSIFDNAPEEMFTRRHVLFSDMQPPPMSPARVPIQFVNPVKKLPNGNLGTESYCREVQQHLKTWYGI